MKESHARHQITAWSIVGSVALVVALVGTAFTLRANHATASDARRQLCFEAQRTRAATARLADSVHDLLVLGRALSLQAATDPVQRESVTRFYRQALGPVDRARLMLHKLDCGKVLNP